MENNKKLLQKAMDVLEKSALSSEDKTLWKERLNTVSDDAVELFIDLFENDSSGLLQTTTGQLRKKVEVGGDFEKINILMEEEKKELLELLQEK